MKKTTRLQILLAVLGAAAVLTAVCSHLSGLNIPYDDVGALYHLGAGLRELALYVLGGLLWLVDLIWLAAGALRRRTGKRKTDGTK